MKNENKAIFFKKILNDCIFGNFVKVCCLKGGLHILLLTLTLFSPMSQFQYLLKTSKNHRFSDVFRGYRNVTLD